MKPLCHHQSQSDPPAASEQSKFFTDIDGYHFQWADAGESQNQANGRGHSWDPELPGFIWKGWELPGMWF